MRYSDANQEVKLPQVDLFMLGYPCRVGVSLLDWGVVVFCLGLDWYAGLRFNGGWMGKLGGVWGTETLGLLWLPLPFFCDGILRPLGG